MAQWNGPREPREGSNIYLYFVSLSFYFGWFNKLWVFYSFWNDIAENMCSQLIVSIKWIAKCKANTPDDSDIAPNNDSIRPMLYAYENSCKPIMIFMLKNRFSPRLWVWPCSIEYPVNTRPCINFCTSKSFIRSKKRWSCIIINLA